MKAGDLGDAVTTGVIVEIGPVNPRSEDQTSREKLEIQVDTIERPILLNATNTIALAEAWGDDYTQWVGQLVAVSAAPTTYEGRATLGIKVRPQKRSLPEVLVGPPTDGQNY
jgi:hypothetical protein